MATLIISITIVCLCSWLCSLGKWKYVGTETVPAVESNLAYYIVPSDGVPLLLSCGCLMTIILAIAIYLMPTYDSLCNV
jgi:hypothetical protein